MQVLVISNVTTLWNSVLLLQWEKQVCLCVRASVQCILREAKVVITCCGLKQSAAEALNDSIFKVKSEFGQMRIKSICKPKSTEHEINTWFTFYPPEGITDTQSSVCFGHSYV